MRTHTHTHTHRLREIGGGGGEWLRERERDWLTDWTLIMQGKRFRHKCLSGNLSLKQLQTLKHTYVYIYIYMIMGEKSMSIIQKSNKSIHNNTGRLCMHIYIYTLETMKLKKKNWGGGGGGFCFVLFCYLQQTASEPFMELCFEAGN